MDDKLYISPGPPPGPVRLPGQKFFLKKFSPFQWTGRWKFATNGGSSQHFFTRLNASKTARIESREDSKTHSVAKIAKNGYFFVKRARRFRNAEGAQDPFRVLYVLGHPKWENLGLQRARFTKK